MRLDLADEGGKGRESRRNAIRMRFDAMGRQADFSRAPEAPDRLQSGATALQPARSGQNDIAEITRRRP
jgi:hypothetical protein